MLKIMKKVISFGIIILCLSICLIPVTISTYTKSLGYSNIITVDDDGDGDYTSIQEAVNNSNPGDTIEVYSGTYYEYNIMIETNDITIKGIPYELGNGSDTGKPFLNGKGNALLFILADGVTFSGFRIENKGPYAAGTITLNSANNCLISENDVSNTPTSSIYCSNCSNTKIINNNLSHSAIRHGIFITESNNNEISGNVIFDMWLKGIFVWSGNKNIITGNIVKRCNEGISLIGNSNLVKQNLLEDNAFGVAVYGGFNKIQQNNFISNNKMDAFFHLDLYTIPLPSFWFNNYWGRPRILPKLIFGFYLFFIPFVQVDWQPAQKPYDIGL